MMRAPVRPVPCNMASARTRAALAVTMFVWLLAGAAAPVAGREQQRQVLVLYSVRRDAAIALVGDRELPQILEQRLAAGVDYYSEFIDSGRFPEPEYREAFRDYLAVKYVGHRFDLVIAIGDVPMAFVTPYRDALFGAAPIVYFSSRPLAPVPNATGITAELDLARTVDLARTLQPDLERLFVVSGADETATEDAARRQLARFASTLEITYLSGLATEALESRLASLPPRSAVYYLVVNRDGAGDLYHPLDYLNRVTAASSAPVYCWVDSAMGRGIVGGSLKDQALEVRILGTLAGRVLEGERADSIPVAAVDLNVTQVDWRQLRRWGIRESLVPASAMVVFREPTAWDRYRWSILAALATLLGQALLIGALMVHRTRRRHAEDRVRQSYDRIRDLGARLLDAQDLERARIARELHDDIGQQMALLEIDLEMLRRAPDRGESLVDDALGRAQGVARSVHDLSHRLHPAKLRLIGLVPALQGLQREFLQSGLPVHFSETGVPAALPPELTLCLFRTAQEAIQNVQKHSDAAEVSVSLAASPGRIVMTIVDDGRGFDVKEAWSRGLGLLSMRERVESVHGAFEIRSSPGAGTRIDVSVPIAPPSPKAAVAGPLVAAPARARE